MTGDPSPDPHQPSEPQFESGLGLPLFKHLHADRNLQGAAVRHQESEEEIRRHYPGNENGAQAGEY